MREFAVPEENRRLEWIDALRALALLLVLYGHCISGCTAYFVFTSPVKIPLFFALTGYLFNESRNKIGDFFLTLLKRLVIPWLVLTLAPALLLTPFRGLPYFLETVRKVFCGELAWYMPCCIIAETLWFFLRKLCRPIGLTAVIAVVSFIAGTLLAERQVLDFLMINRALTVLLFLLIGRLYREYEPSIIRKRKTILYLLIAAVLYGVLGAAFLRMFPGRALDVHQNAYYSYSITLCMILIGLWILFTAFRMIHCRFPKFLLLIGRNTLPIYLIHTWFLAFCRILLRSVGAPVGNALLAIPVTITVGAGSLAVALVLAQVAPQLVGKTKMERREKFHESN